MNASMVLIYICVSRNGVGKNARSIFVKQKCVFVVGDCLLDVSLMNETTLRQRRIPKYESVRLDCLFVCNEDTLQQLHSHPYTCKGCMFRSAFYFYLQ